MSSTFVELEPMALQNLRRARHGFSELHNSSPQKGMDTLGCGLCCDVYHYVCLLSILYSGWKKTLATALKKLISKINGLFSWAWCRGSSRRWRDSFSLPYFLGSSLFQGAQVWRFMKKNSKQQEAHSGLDSGVWNLAFHSLAVWTWQVSPFALRNNLIISTEV